jgi:hypothetical protein
MTTIQKLEWILKKFMLERILYVIIILGSSVLIGIICYKLLRKDSIEAIILMLGPAGAIAVCSAQLLKMWEDCIEVIKLDTPKKSEPKS